MLQKVSAQNQYCSSGKSIAHLRLNTVNNAKMDTTWIHFSNINVRSKKNSTTPSADAPQLQKKKKKIKL